MMCAHVRRLLGVAIAVLSVAVGSAHALVYQLGRSIADSPVPSSAPWMRIDLANDEDGTVLMTIACDAPSSRFACDVWMNFDPDPLTAGLLDGLYVIPSPGQPAPVITKGADSISAEGRGSYDIRLSFLSDGASLIGPSGVLSFRLASSNGALFDTLFDFTCHPGNAAQRHGAAARFQSLPDDQTSWLQTGVPPPSIVRVPDAALTAVLLGLALLALGLAGRRRAA